MMRPDAHALIGLKILAAAVHRLTGLPLRLPLHLAPFLLPLPAACQSSPEKLTGTPVLHIRVISDGQSSGNHAPAVALGAD